MFRKRRFRGDPAAEPVPGSPGRDSFDSSEGKPERRPRPPELADLRAGKKEAWERFVEFFQAFSAGLISRWFKDCRDPEELQDGLLCRVTCSILGGKGPSSPEGLVPWLRGAVLKACATGIRERQSERKRTARRAGGDSRAEPVPSQPSGGGASLPRLRELVPHLPPGKERCRSALRLRARKTPWSYRRAARRYGVKPGTVRCWVCRATRFLRGVPPSVPGRPSE